MCNMRELVVYITSHKSISCLVFIALVNIDILINSGRGWVFVTVVIFDVVVVVVDSVGEHVDVVGNVEVDVVWYNRVFICK